MKIAVVGGTGSQGRGLALRWATAGHEVWIGSRDASRAAEAASALEHGIRGDDNASACKAADVIALCIPFSAQKEILSSIRTAAEGKVVIDMTVPLVPGRPPKYPSDRLKSAAESTQEMLPLSRVVGAFHNVAAGLLSSDKKHLDIDVLICGDDAAAKETTTKLVRAVGARPIDAGPLDTARTVERITAMLIGLNIRYKKKHIGIKLTGLDET